MSHRTVVYRYAVHGDLPDAATAELGRAHQLHARLVEIERAYGEQVAAVWAAQPQLAAADQRGQELTTRVTELTRAAAAERAHTGRRRVAAETAQALHDARAARRQASTARRQLQERLYPIVRPQMIGQVQMPPRGPALMSTKPKVVKMPVVIEMNEKPRAKESNDRNERSNCGR
jgi:hypothetical protein